ncbi:hypothetical protein NQ315_001333 [Exocentrus adspersus]|uniref:Multidrug resistance-associated protein lethal(2)03659 n=1 Tax=Exocentrus adspersus TaxID=1586481 RepID=A0AAV8WF09_9CUCU|nr:hypothetical protein NQ315_001333 [Exocentrus adspersus]
MAERVDPRRETNTFSLLLFGYTVGLFRKGLRRDLEEEDLYGIKESCGSKRCGDGAEAQWDKTRSIYKLLWRRHGREYTAICFATILWTEINSISQPYGQSKLISYFESSQSDISKTDAYYCAGIVTLLKVASVFFWRHIAIYEFYLGIKIRASLKSLLYRKALRLSSAAFSDTNLGNIVTILTKDINTIEENLWMMMEFVIAFIQTGTISYLLWNRMGNAAFVGIGLLFFSLPLQIYLCSLLTGIRLRVGKYSDARLLLTQETLSAMKIVKMYGWENFFYKKIAEARKKEVSIMMKGLYLKFAVAIIAFLNSKLTFLLLILCYIWLGNTTSTETIFYVLTLYYDLKMIFGWTIPYNTSKAAEFRAALIRLNKLLNTEEVKKLREQNNEKACLELDQVTVKVKSDVILKRVCFKVDSPGLVLVTGAVGSGKSVLLKTMLQEYPCEGVVNVRGTVSYASQEPWLFPASIKDNIMFGQEYNKERYEEVVRCCALEYDFSLLEQGDETLVVDRGANLSKGQQARVNLARAVYKDSDVYLLDDSLTALDVQVQDFIFEECIRKFLDGRIRVLVTQNVTHMKKVGKVVTLEEGCLVVHQKVVSDGRSAVTVEEEENTDASTGGDNRTDDNKVYQETKKQGKVELVVYKKYFRFGGGLLLFTAIMIGYILSQFLESYSDQLQTDWVDLQKEVLDLSNTTNTTALETKTTEKDVTFVWYTALTIINAITALLKFYVLLRFCRTASINIHRIMSHRVINALMTFFDTHLIGNILNRFSYDLYNIDESLPFVFPDMTATLFVCAGSLILLVNVNWIFLFPSGLFIVGLVLVRMGYMPTGRSLKRLEAATRSPLVGLINSSLEGLTTIRASKAEPLLRNQFDVNQDLYSSAYFTLMCSTTAFEFFMDVLCALFSTLVVVRFLFFDHDISAGNVGLALTQVFMLTEYIQWGVRLWADVENHMTSVERVLEYTNDKNEEHTGKEPDHWPKQGSVVFRNVTLSYQNTTRPVLKDVSFEIQSGQRVGIVGRTGAGKSSIISTLFRLYDFQGSVLVDGVDTKQLPLSLLRKNISIIPQDPVLFTGTIRSNIDPDNLYPDEELWKVIEKVGIKSLIPELDLSVVEGGCGFSMGQKQLICLVRAAVRKCKIVVLDEATANMDAVTDEMLHQVVKDMFEGGTVLMIAHRLASILDCDKVIVMDKGEVAEIGTPRALLRDKRTAFYSMCKECEKIKSLVD